MASPAHNPQAILQAALAASGVPTSEQVPAGPATIGNALGQVPQPPQPQVVPGLEASQPAAPTPAEQAAPSPAIPTPEEMAAAAAAGSSATLPQPAKDPLEALREELGTFRLNQATGVGQIAREVAALKVLLAERASPTPQFDASADPVVKLHSDQIAAIDADVAANNADMGRLAQQGEPLLSEKARLEGEVAYARRVSDADGEQRAQARIAQLDGQYAALYGQYRQLAAETKALQRNRTEKEFNRLTAAQSAEARHSEQIAEQRARETFHAEKGQVDRAAFDAAVAEQVTRYGMKDAAAFREFAVNQLQAWANNNSNSPAMPTEALKVFVQQSADALARTYGLSPKADFTADSRAKAAAAISVMSSPTPQPQASGLAPTTTAFDALPTGQQVELIKAHARRVLSGQGR